MKRAEPPSALPRRPHTRTKPRLSTDNEAVAAQLGCLGRMGARPRGGGEEEEDRWAKPRLSTHPYWWAPPFSARPLTDLSLCDRRRGQFLLGRGRSQRLPELRPDSGGLLLLLFSAGRAAGVRENVIASPCCGAASVCSFFSGTLVPSAFAAAAAALGIRMASGAQGPSGLRERRSLPLLRRRLPAAASTPPSPGLAALRAGAR